MGLFPKNFKLNPKIRGTGCGEAFRLFPAVYRIAPALKDADRLLADQATSDSETTVVLLASILAQPDVPRQLEILPGGVTADVPAGDIVVEGTDISGKVITENVTLLANQSSAEVSVLAFATVTKITFPIQDGAGATYDVGTGAKVGLPHIVGSNYRDASLFDGSTDAGTWTYDADELEKNVYAAAGTFDGAKILELKYHVAAGF